MRLIGFCQLPVYPANQVSFGDVSDEQQQGIRDLVQAAVAQLVPGQWTAREMLWSAAGASTLPVAAIREAPVAFQFWAGSVFETDLDFCQTRKAMPLDVATRNLVRDALEAECVQQPLKKISRVVLLNGYSNRRFQINE